MATVVDHFGDTDKPIALHSLEIGAAGELALREPQFPLSFAFHWRKSEFQAEIGRGQSGLYLRLCASVAKVPFTAENPSERSRLLAIVTSPAETGSGKLEIENDHSVALCKKVDLPAGEGLTATGLVTYMSVVVLSPAPYLDLVAELDAA